MARRTSLRWLRHAGLCGCLLAIGVAVASLAQQRPTFLVSVSSSGEQGNHDSGWALSISANGRYVAFSSKASNIVAGDTNEAWDAFVHDRQTGETSRVSVSSSGWQGNEDSGYLSPGGYIGLSISADGRYVAFVSLANNLVPGDTNAAEDVFVHDRLTGDTTRVSVSSSGEQGDSGSGYIGLSISADGRYVAFGSPASNLVADDTNGYRDTFVHDRQTDQTTRVSVSSSGGQARYTSFRCSISANGRYVAFGSLANNLVPGDTNAVEDAFVHDLQTGETKLVSVSSSGDQGDDGSGNGELSISADGRYVAFESRASNLVVNDTNAEADIFVHDRQTGQTSRVSVSSSGGQANTGSLWPSISADGRYVAFTSLARNLVPGDTNGVFDIFVHDRQTGQTSSVSVSTSGGQGNDQSLYPSISTDGRYVAFSSWASNLVAGDTNRKGDAFVRRYWKTPQSIPPRR